MLRPFVLVIVVATACGDAPAEPPPPSESVVQQLVVNELEKARRESALAQAQALRNAVDLYVVTKASCPASVDALVETKMVAQAPKDPWGRPFVLTCKDAGASIAIASPGADGQPDTADDIVVNRD